MADGSDKYVLLRITALLVFLLPQIAVSIDFTSLPNVLLLVVDNLGFSDLGCFGNSSNNTPNIDRLAHEGVRFTRWYSQSSSASTRASILTGLLPIKTGMIKSRYLPFKAMPSLASTGGLQLDQITLAEVLKRKDYSTAFIGHWGLGVGRKGAFLPINQGFDHWYGVPALHNQYCLLYESNETNKSSTNDEYRDEGPPSLRTLPLVALFAFTVILGGLTGLWMFKKIDMMTFVCLAAPELFLVYLTYFSLHFMDFVHSRNCILYRDGMIIEQPYLVNNMTLRFTKETVKIIKDLSSKPNPFFIMHSYLKLHSPLHISHTFLNCKESNQLSCALQELDWSVGKILNTLESLGIENETIVILTSSSGPCVGVDDICHRKYGFGMTDKREYKPLRGGGNNVWEGDIRIPTIIRWNMTLQPTQMINATTTCMDIVPTLMEITNQSLDLPTDGKSLVPLLHSSFTASQSRNVFHYTDIFRPSAITYGRYKFVFITQSDEGVTTFHDPPFVFDIEADPGEENAIPVDQLPDELSIVTTELEEHLANRTDKGVSQFDNPFMPLLFPCVNLPSCTRLNSEDDDFSELFNDSSNLNEDQF